MFLGSGNDGYRDVKLNVIFRGQDGQSMVAEVQLILKAMMLFKERAHGLYEITRDLKPVCSDDGS